MLKEPMLAAKVDFKKLEELQFPLLGSPKLDGYRATVVDGYEPGRPQLLSRKLKRIRNPHTCSLLERTDMFGLDGELIVGLPHATDVFRRTSSGVTTQSGEPDVKFYVFDNYTHGAPFHKRISDLELRVRALGAIGVPVRYVKHHVLNNVAELLAFEERCVSRGFEGIMLRDPNGPYKQGRATAREGWLFKVKRFVDFEAEIIGVKEGLHNANEATVNELGRTKRSSHKANKIPKDAFGGLILRTRAGVVFNAPMGKGWDDAGKAELWHMRDTLPGQWVTCESFPVGVKDKPRFPKVKDFNFTVKGIRDTADMGD